MKDYLYTCRTEAWKSNGWQALREDSEPCEAENDAEAASCVEDFPDDDFFTETEDVAGATRRKRIIITADDDEAFTAVSDWRYFAPRT